MRVLQRRVKGERMMLNELKIFLTQDRYKNFTVLKEPTDFCKLFKDKNFGLVQVHTYIDDVGFCGAFGWKNNKLESLDGDSYNEEMIVYAYSTFGEKGKEALDIVVGEDWYLICL